MSAVEPTTPPEPRTRREVLCGLVLAIAAPGALVAACSDTPTPTPGTSAPAAPTGAGTPNTGLAALADVPQESGLVVASTKGTLVLVRPSADTVKAFDARCPHQGFTLVPPVGGTITCPNHGSTFDGKTGALKGGPATSGLKEVPVKIEAGQVLLA